MGTDPVASVAVLPLRGSARSRRDRRAGDDAGQHAARGERTWSSATSRLTDAVQAGSDPFPTWLGAPPGTHPRRARRCWPRIGERSRSRSGRVVPRGSSVAVTRIKFRFLPRRQHGGPYARDRGGVVTLARRITRRHTGPRRGVGGRVVALRLEPFGITNIGMARVYPTRGEPTACIRVGGPNAS